MVELTGVTLLALTAAGFVALVVRYFLFRVGCILADLPDLAVGRSILAVVLAVAITVPLIVIAGIQLVSLEKRLSAQAGMIFYPAMAGSLVICWWLAAFIYRLALSTSYAKGLTVAGVELLLSALLAGLVAAILLVLGAAWQISQPGRALSQSELPGLLVPGAQHGDLT
jgi:hypothetical protein